ncbi:hypothetical protein ABVK25_001637 [Lepraria finkii]|uniref:Secreted protein n=1 Tax=Lepraria finkii TaxID=1340010 RepID=A0ABR4BJN5_9LECA
MLVRFNLLLALGSSQLLMWYSVEPSICQAEGNAFDSTVQTHRLKPCFQAFEKVKTLPKECELSGQLGEEVQVGPHHLPSPKQFSSRLKFGSSSFTPRSSRGKLSYSHGNHEEAT